MSPELQRKLIGEACGYSDVRPEHWEDIDGLRRLIDLARALRRHEPISAASAASERGLSTKTLMRDFDMLRSFGWEIEWDAKERTYVLISAPKPTLF